MFQKEERQYSSSGIAFLLLLFFFIILSFSQKSEIKISEKTAIEIAAKTYFDYSHAISINNIQLPLFKQNWVSFIDKLNIKFFNKELKCLADTYKLNQQFLTLQKANLAQMPLYVDQFYQFWFSNSIDELAILS